MKSQIVRRAPDGSMKCIFPKRHVQGIKVEVQGAERELLEKVAAYCSRTAKEAKGTEEAEIITFAMQIVKKRALSSRRALERTIDHRLEALRKGEEEAPPPKAEIRELQADLPLGEALAERTATRVLRSALPKEERLRKAEVRALTAIRRILKGLPPRDPKIERLIQEIQAVRRKEPDAKLIVFTEYRDTLAAINDRLDESDDISGQAVVLQGGLSIRQRIRVQERFEGQGANILLATDAASEGLNLQRSCRRIVHFELPWNPNRLEQRNGRVDRYGQTREPEIRYLYYPDSPEDDVLHRLIEKIEGMQEDRVSTPDILGILQGMDLDAALVEMSPEGDPESGKKSLIRLFEDRTAEFVRGVKPLLAPGGLAPEQLPTSGEAIFEDNLPFEEVALALLGSHARPTETGGIHRIDVPLAYRGAAVERSYPRATFRRSVASRFRAADVEFITPLHPLARAMTSEARRRLLQVYPDEKGLPARRLAARRVPKGEAASVVFTFLGSIAGADGPLEDRVLAVRITPDLELAEDPERAWRWLAKVDQPGEVAPEIAGRLFKARFDAMVPKASEIALGWLKDRSRAIRGNREKLAEALRQDAKIDLADRLREIEEEERRARGLFEEETHQLRLFAAEDAKKISFDAKRQVARVQAEKREEEIAAFVQVQDPASPSPLGALLLVPEGIR